MKLFCYSFFVAFFVILIYVYAPVVNAQDCSLLQPCNSSNQCCTLLGNLGKCKALSIKGEVCEPLPMINKAYMNHCSCGDNLKCMMNNNLQYVCQ